MANEPVILNVYDMVRIHLNQSALAFCSLFSHCPLFGIYTQNNGLGSEGIHMCSCFENQGVGYLQQSPLLQYHF